MTTNVDTLVDRGADQVQELADRAAQGDGVASRLGQPSPMKARAKGQAPTDENPGEVRPAGAQLGPNPFVVAGAALGVGIFLAKWIDWRGHAHPRR